MQFTSALLAAGFAALASAQISGSTITPTAAAPSGCATTYPSTFELSVVNITSSSSKVKRQVSPNTLTISLKNGVLSDNTGRIGYIASSYQFQFDTNGQAGELYNAGFSVCSNNTLALGGSAVWYECLSGSFYNLYSQNWAPQCQAIYLDVIPQSSSASATTTTASQTASTQSAGTSVSKTTTSAAVASSISDGQAQGGSTTAIVSSVSVITSVKSSTSSAAVISSITDHQIQAPTSTSAVASATTSMSTITSMSTVTKAASTSSTSVAIISSISDHQIQAPTSTSVQVYTGAAAMPTMAAQVVLAVAGAAVALL